eukprot:8788938-Prorocentrum_lima.AAC.1
MSSVSWVCGWTLAQMPARSLQSASSMCWGRVSCLPPCSRQDASCIADGSGDVSRGNRRLPRLRVAGCEPPKPSCFP